MRDKDLYARILKIEDPWRVADVELNLEQGEVVVHVEHDGEALTCPQCGQPARRYDTRRRRWRHLDTCEYRTILAAEMPRVHDFEERREESLVAPAELAKYGVDSLRVCISLLVCLGFREHGRKSERLREAVKQQFVRFDRTDESIPSVYGRWTEMARSASVVVETLYPKDQMTNDSEHIRDPVLPGSRPHSEAFGKRGDDLSASSRGVGEVLDLKVAGVANQSLRQLGREQWLERAVFIDSDLVA